MFSQNATASPPATTAGPTTTTVPAKGGIAFVKTTRIRITTPT